MLVITFLLVLLLTFSIVLAGTRQNTLSKPLKLRLAQIRDSTRSAATGKPLFDLVEVEQPRLVDRFGHHLARFGFSAKLAKLIVHASSNATVGGVVLSSIAAGLSTTLVVFFFTRFWLLLLAAMLLGSMLPWALLRWKSARRLKKFDTALPDAIDLFARSLRAGHSIGASMEMIADQSPEPIAGEFSRLFQQQRFGLRFRDALLEMTDRVPSPDLHFLVTAILVQRETGGDLTDILDRTTHVIRERIRIQGEVRVYTAQGKLTGWILSLLPVVLLVLINLISPGYSRMLFHDPTGQKLLYAGATCILIGAFIISRIVDIKV